MRRKLVLTVAVVAAAATAATAWAVLRGSPAHETTSVECVIQGVDTVIPSTSGDPAQDCAVEWKRELGSAAPPLRAYDNGLGGVTVIPLNREATVGLEAARLRAGRRSDPTPGLARRLRQRSQLELLRQRRRDDIRGCEARAVRLHGLDGRRAQPVVTGDDRRRPDSDRWSEAGAGRVHGGYADVCRRRARRPHHGVGHAVREPCSEGAEDGVREARRQAPADHSEVRIPAGRRRVGARRRRAAWDSRSLRPDYDLNTVTDNSMRCASIYETVGGTIFLTVRGPHG